MNKHNSTAMAEKKKFKYNCHLSYEKAEMSLCD